MTSSRFHVAESLVRVLQKYAENQRIARSYGIREHLYPAEIHMVMYVGNHPEAGPSELANLAGITKGAVSQMVDRLEKKGLVSRVAHPEDRKRIRLKLTAKGKRAYATHEQFHAEQDRELLAFLDSLSPAEVRAIEQFLEMLEVGMDRRGK